MLAYSTSGLTRVKYALSFKDVAPILRFPLKNPIVLFALSQMLSICWSHFRSGTDNLLRFTKLIKCIPEF